VSRANPRSPQEHARARRLATPSPVGGAVPASPAHRAATSSAPRLFEDGIAYAQPTFAVAVSHAPWRADRVANMARVRPVLQRPGTPYYEETGKAPLHVWSRRMWGWGVAQPVTHTLYIQDDLDLCPDFWRVVEAMVRAVPNHILALISNHPMSDRALADGHAWFRMCEVLGSAYVAPTVLMACFLDWLDRLPAGVAASNCEDFLITRWQHETGRRAWCPIPSPVQTKDHEIRSTNAVVGYAHQRSYLDWRDRRVVGAPLTDVAYWRRRRDPPDFGPTVTNDSRLGPGPFKTADVVAAHHRLVGDAA
jgi:hypothetical protein